MSFVDDILPTLDAIRTDIPGDLGKRSVSLQVLVRTWSGDRVGSGSFSDLRYPIVGINGNSYKAVAHNGKEIAAAGGKYDAATYKIGPITRAFPGGRFTANQLNPLPSSASVELYYGVTDATGLTYWCTKVNDTTDNATQWFLYLQPTGVDI